MTGGKGMSTIDRIEERYEAEIAELKAEIESFIDKAADFIGTDKELRCTACIDAALDHARTLRKELSEAWMEIKRLKLLINTVVANAVIGPDAIMSGTTDCYHVPLDDIEVLKEETARQNEGRKTFEIFFRDLKPDAQKNLCEAFRTMEHDENWDAFPLFTLEREDMEAS
jgi:predicted RNase H-like nuclease (RuvC/YqgF family)